MGNLTQKERKVFTKPNLAKENSIFLIIWRVLNHGSSNEAFSYIKKKNPKTEIVISLKHLVISSMKIPYVLVLGILMDF